MDPFAGSQGGVQPPAQQPINPAQYQFSSDELRVLRECNIESFYQRSLPFGAALGVAAWAAVKRGMLKGSPKYGPIPKVVLGVVVGYFAGKFSYQGKCAEKIMRLPNSQLGEMLRKRRKGGFSEGFSMDPSGGAFGMGSNVPVDPNADQSFRANGSALDMDVTRPSMSGLDDTFRPNVDSAATNFDDMLPLDPPPKNGTTYDELRKAHREEYQRKMNAGQQTNPGVQRQAPAQQYKPPQGNYPQQQQPEDPPSRNAQKNKYGDVWN